MPVDQVTWLPVCAGLTALGVVAAFFAFRRRGVASGLRLLGWAALPAAAYLTGVVTLLWRIGVDVARFAGHFILSMTVWLGVAVFGVAVLLFVVSGLLRGRGGEPRSEESQRAGTGEQAKAAPGQPRRTRGEVGRGSAGEDQIEGLDEIEEILRRRGIS